MLKVNEEIPEIKTNAYYEDEIKEINLSDYRGKWLVLLFYPADFTFVCPTELEQAAENYDKFKEQDAEIMSVSRDTAYVHKAWQDHSEAISKVDYPMLADPTGEICGEFGTHIPEEGVSQRATFIINPEGKVKSIEIHDNDIGRNIMETLRKLKAAKFVRENDGEVCPANWDTGDDSLETGVDQVGEI